MAARVGLLSNPGSRNNRAGVIQTLERIARQAGCPTDRGSDAASLDRAIERLLANRIDLLIVNGGDGTAQRVFSRIAQHPGPAPLIGLLAGGRTNASAIDAGSAGRMVPQLQDFLRWAAGRVPGREVVRPLLKVSVDGEPLGYGLFVAGAGLSLAIEDCRAFRARQPAPLAGTAGTLLWSVGLAARALLRGRPLPAGAVELTGPEGRLFAGPAALLLATTLRRLPAGIYPFRVDAADPLRLTLITPECRCRWRSIGPLLRGRRHPALVPDNGYHFWQGGPFSLASGQPLLLDGERLEPRTAPFRIAADREIRLLQTAGVRS